METSLYLDITETSDLSGANYQDESVKSCIKKKSEDELNNKSTNPKSIISSTIANKNCRILKMYDRLCFQYGSCKISWQQNKKGEYTKKPKYIITDGDNNIISSTWKKNVYISDKKYNGLFIKTGIDSDLVVLDLDDMDHQSNIILYGKAINNCNMVVKTKKGYHLYFKYSDNFPFTHHNKEHKFDILSTGSHIFAPPSYYYDHNNNKNVYTFMKKPQLKLEPTSTELIEILTNYISSDLAKISNDVSKQIKKNNTQTKKYKETHKHTKKTNENDMLILLNNLNIKRVDDLCSWLIVGFALCYDNYSWTLWDTFSKRSVNDKYVDGECYYKFKQLANYMGPEPVTTATLWYWLKQDNINVFKDLKFKELTFPGYKTSLIETHNRFDINTMGDLLHQDKILFDTYFSYIFDKTNSFLYFNKFHCYVTKSNTFFRFNFIGKRYSISKIEKPSVIYKSLLADNKLFGDVWEGSMSKLIFDEIIFKPYFVNNVEPYYLNLFTGHKYYDPNHIVDPDKLDCFIHHIKYICNYQENVSEYIINWLAHIIQNPTRKTETAIVFYSYLEGIGKNAFTDIVTKLFDNYVGKLANIDMINNKFNSDLSAKLVIIGDEIRATATALANELKNIITQKTARIEFKGKDPVILDDYCNYIFTTNNELILKISESDRRYCLIECPEVKKDQKYFEQLYSFINDDEYITNFFMFLATKDLNNFTCRNIPITDYKLRNVINSMPSFIQMLRTNYQDFAGHQFDTRELFNLSITFAKNNRLSSCYSFQFFAKQFKKTFGVFYKRDKGKRFYIFPEFPCVIKVTKKNVTDDHRFKHIDAFLLFLLG